MGGRHRCGDGRWRRSDSADRAATVWTHAGHPVGDPATGARRRRRGGDLRCVRRGRRSGDGSGPGRIDATRPGRRRPGQRRSGRWPGRRTTTPTTTRCCTPTRRRTATTPERREPSPSTCRPTGPVDVDKPRSWQRLPQLLFGVGGCGGPAGRRRRRRRADPAVDDARPSPSTAPLTATSAPPTSVAPPPPPSRKRRRASSR